MSPVRANTPQPGPIPDPDPPPIPGPEPPNPPPSPPNPLPPNPPPDPPGHEPQPDQPPMPQAALVYVVQIRVDEDAVATERRLRFATEEEAAEAFMSALSAGLWADVRVVHGRIPRSRTE